MGVDESIKVNRLSEKEAWELFRKKVGEDALNIDLEEIPQLAQTIAKLYDGVSLALLTVGRAMAYKKTVPKWRRSIEVLRKSIQKFQVQRIQSLLDWGGIFR